MKTCLYIHLYNNNFESIQSNSSSIKNIKHFEELQELKNKKDKEFDFNKLYTGVIFQKNLSTKKIQKSISKLVKKSTEN